MSFAEQLERIERHVSDQGWELTAVFDDSGAEVGLREHPRLDRLLTEPGEVRKLVVAGVDRLGRLPRPTLAAVRCLRERGIDLVCIDEGIDTGVDSGGMLEPTLARLAHWQPGPRQPAGWDPERLRSHGFAPATVIDVGVASGTPPLYKAFDNAYLVLLEPLEEHGPELERLASTRPAEYLQTAVGAREGTISIDVDRVPTLSSVVPTLGERDVVETREVPMTTIDRLAATRDWADPLGLKIDVEGYEQQVIEGALETLPRCEFLILDASVVPRYEDDLTCRGLIALLRGHGLEVCDVIDTGGTAGSLFVDLMFERRQK